jgi:hypothetical protein
MKLCFLVGVARFDFQGIDRGGEGHGCYDQRSVMAERCIGSDEDMWHKFFLCGGCLVSSSGSLAFGVQSCDFRGDLH